MRAISVTAITTALLVTGLAPASQAATKVHEDASADVIRVDKTFTVSEPAPGQRDGDITKLVVNHGDTVVIKASFRELKVPEDAVDYFIPVRTNESLQREVSINVDPTTPQGTFEISGGGTCADLAGKISYTHNTVRIGVPRTCLSRPQWVRVGLGVRRVGLVNEAVVYYFDDAMLDGAINEAGPKLGPKVFRN